MSVVHKHGFCEYVMDIGPVNAFAKADIVELNDLFTSCEQAFSSDNRLLVIKSCKISPSGYPVFCAGANQKERVGWGFEQILEHVAFQRSVIHKMRTLPQFVICCVDGLALGLGTELCLAADVVIASQNAEFGFPEKNWGIVPGAGGYAWAHGWAQHPDVAQKYIEDGMRFDSEHAQWLGIVDILCNSENFDIQLDDLLEKIQKMSLQEQILTKKNRHEKIDYSFWFGQEQNAYAEALKKKMHK